MRDNDTNSGRHLVVFSKDQALAANLHDEIDPNNCWIKYQNPQDSLDENDDRVLVWIITDTDDIKKIKPEGELIWLYGETKRDDIESFLSWGELVDKINSKLHGSLGNIEVAPYCGWKLSPTKIKEIKSLDKLWWAFPKATILSEKKLNNLQRILHRYQINGFSIEKCDFGARLVKN